jgi:hypothetical protein
MANQGGSHGQNVKAGQQGKNQSAQQASGASHSSSSKGAQGGSHEQHVKAGQQSHKKGH